MIVELFHIEDARKLVREAGLQGQWSQSGTDTGFADWLYLKSFEVDPEDLRLEVDEYLWGWLRARGSGEDFDRVLRKEVDRKMALITTQKKTCDEMADAIALVRQSEVGPKVLDALNSLATSAGRDLGPDALEVPSLELLNWLLGQLSASVQVVSAEHLGQCGDFFASAPAGVRQHFAEIERHLREEPLHPEFAAHDSVMLLVALARDESASANVQARLRAAKMNEHIGGGTPGAASSGRRGRQGV